MSSKTIKYFNNVAAMKAATDLSSGDICETLGYYNVGDGGGARYTVGIAGSTETDNGGSIISITGVTSVNLVARFMNEGKPVNVLQFGAHNEHTWLPNREVPTDRNDSVAIQLAIDYTYDLLDDISNNAYYNSINTIIIPAGNYVICDQINMPPMLQIQLDGDAQFYSFVTANDVTLYRYDSVNKDMVAIPAENVGINADDVVYSEKEVFAKYNVKKNGEDVTVNKLGKEEYFVYKKGIFKICNRYNADGTIHDPYNGRYIVSAIANTEIFTGCGSLTILNKINSTVQNSQGEDAAVSPCYICGIEVGSTEDYIRSYEELNKPEDERNTKNAGFTYNNICFKNLKVAYCNVGLLSHGYSFYTNKIKNCEFFQNTVGFQFGLYGETENVNSTKLIIGEVQVDSIEMNHFRDCLFTGNKIAVNNMLSGSILNFNSCHFDYENCIFRTCYRTNITVANCHIEGIGDEICKWYFPNGTPTSSEITAFKNRANTRFTDEFVGLLYTKPLRKFTGARTECRAYINLSIVSSLIIDKTVNMPWSLFSYYNSGTATLSDGHNRSNLYLENNTITTSRKYPICYHNFNDDGIIQSGFMLSEFPEAISGSDGTVPNLHGETSIVKNVPVISKDNKKWGAFGVVADSPRNHRFLSNRTLALKYPYFQNLSNADSIYITTGATIDTSQAPNTSAVLNITNRHNISPFVSLDDNAKYFAVSHTPTIEQINYETQPIVSFSFDNDLIDCQKDDAFHAALVTNRILSNCSYAEGETNDDGTKNYTLIDREAVTHTIKFVEMNSNGDVLGIYGYDVTYFTKNIDIDSYDSLFPSTSTCRHIIHNKDAVKVKVLVDFAVPIKNGPLEMNHNTTSRLHAVLVEKNK